jgi:hypothetical protein
LTLANDEDRMRLLSVNILKHGLPNAASDIVNQVMSLAQ